MTCERSKPRENAALAIASPFVCYSRVTSLDSLKWRAYWQVKAKKKTRMHSDVFEYIWCKSLRFYNHYFSFKITFRNYVKLGTVHQTHESFSKTLCCGSYYQISCWVLITHAPEVRSWNNFTAPWWHGTDGTFFLIPFLHLRLRCLGSHVWTANPTQEKETFSISCVGACVCVCICVDVVHTCIFLLLRLHLCLHLRRTCDPG